MLPKRWIALLAASAMFASATAQAATLETIYGQALVNRGNGYELAVAGTQLNPGDIVAVNPGGLARIAYPDGCAAPVEPGSIVAVAEVSPCSSITTGAAQQNQPTFDVNTGVLIGGVVAAGVGIAALLNANKDKPASP